MPGCKLIFITLLSCSKALWLWYSDLCIIQYQARIDLLRIKPVPSTTLREHLKLSSLRAQYLFWRVLVQLFLKVNVKAIGISSDRHRSPKNGKRSPPKQKGARYRDDRTTRE